MAQRKWKWAKIVSGVVTLPRRYFGPEYLDPGPAYAVQVQIIGETTDGRFYYRNVKGDPTSALRSFRRQELT